MLILYNKDEKQFFSNGIGVLDNYAFDDLVSEELNGMFKLEFTYPMFSPHAKHLTIDNIVRATTPDGEQPFFITRTINKDGYLTVTAYHIFYKLIWKLIEDINIVKLSSQGALTRILENTGYTGVSTVSGLNSIRIVRYNVVESILNSGKDNTFISRFGGEIKRDKFLVEFRPKIGRTYENNPVEIRYAKNLENYDVDIDSTNVATRIMPIAFNGLLLPEKYVIKPGTLPDDYKTLKKEYSDIKAIEDVEDPKDDELPLEEAYQAMRDAVLTDFENGVYDVKANYKITHQELSKTEEYKNKAVLESIYLGDEVRVIHEDDEIDIIARMISYRWSPLREEYEETELGNYQEKFSDIKPTIDIVIGKIDENKSLTELEIEYVTGLLTSALGGNVLKINGELLIMDTDDPNTATKVWRFNLNGLGYSGTGINGPYETAITMDGHILGKFIQVLKLSAISADLGTVTAGKMLSPDGTLDISLNDKTFRIGSEGEEVSTGIKYNGIEVKDEEKLISAFGDSGAIVPALDVTIIQSNDVVQPRDGGTYIVGNGEGEYTSLTDAINSLFWDSRKYLRNNIVIEIKKDLAENIDIDGLTGYGLSIKFTDGVTYTGRIRFINCSNQVTVYSSGTRSMLKGSYSCMTFIGCPMGEVGFMDIAANDVAVYVSDNSRVLINGLDSGTTSFGVLADKGSIIQMTACKGNNTTAIDMRNGSACFTDGAIPFGNLIGNIISKNVSRVGSFFSAPPAPVNKIFKSVFSNVSLDTLSNGGNYVSAYYGKAAAQNKWTGMTTWAMGRIKMGNAIQQYIEGGSSVSIKMRMHRKNTSHGAPSSAISPTPSNFTCSMSGAKQNEWTGWGNISSVYFGSTVDLRIGANTFSNYAIWDAVQFEVTVTKQV